MPPEAVAAPAPRGVPLARRLMLFLAVLGPGLITASVDNDAGGITTYSVAGARYGYDLLWTLIPITLALIVIQEMSARMGVVTGKGLSDLIRENFGVRITFWVSIALIVANLGNVIAEFAGVAASLQIFGVPVWASVPAAAAGVWLLVLKGTYRSVEKFFLIASAFYVCYPITLFFAKPDWAEVGIKLVVPTVHADAAFIGMLIAMVGTTIAPWMQFYLQAAVVEKRIRVEHYPLSRLDVVAGCVVTDLVAFAIVVACAATLNRSGVAVDTAGQAAMALEPLAGRYATWLFAFGLFNASFFAAAILPLSTAYYVCEAFGWESGVDRKYGEARQFYWLYTSILVIGAAIVLWPRLPLVPIMLISQIVNGMLLPFILIFMLVLINKRKLMGEWRNGRFFNAVAWGTTVIMIALTAYLVVASLRDLLA
jgi:NRAMP (natural resistance-associated macrophage protein)-like metal ion transporter